MNQKLSITPSRRTYTSPRFRELPLNLESAFLNSGGFGIPDVEEEEMDW